MKKLFTYVIMLYASLSVSVAQQIQYPEPVLNPESCTSIMVGKSLGGWFRDDQPHLR